MSLGIEVSDEDLHAIRKLFSVRWNAGIKNWKERDTDYCLWFVQCPDNAGNYITKTGNSLADTIQAILTELGYW